MDMNRNLLGEIRQVNEYIRVEVERLISIDDREGSISIVSVRIDDNIKVYLPRRKVCQDKC